MLAGLALVFGFTGGCVTPQRPYDLAASERLQKIDRAGFDALLAAHVADGSVDYAAFCDVAGFDRYIADLARADLADTSKAERLGFYINAYNALAIRGILGGSSPSTLLGRYGFFVRDRYRVAGREMNLLTLERKVLIPMGEPRIHFAIVCASASCPKLSARAYDADRLEAQLEEAARRFVNDPVRNRFDVALGRAELSPVFDWYRDEFAASAGSLEAFVARYVDDAQVATRLRAGELEIDFGDYDWQRNGASPGPGDRCPEVLDGS